MVSLLTLFSGTVTGSGNGSSIDTGDGNNWGVAAFLDVASVSGTSPTLNVVVQDSPDGDKWYDLITFTQATQAGNEVKRELNVFGRYLRVKYTVGGDSPQFVFDVKAELRYRP